MPEINIDQPTQEEKNRANDTQSVKPEKTEKQLEAERWLADFIRKQSKECASHFAFSYSCRSKILIPQSRIWQSIPGLYSQNHRQSRWLEQAL